MSCFPAEWPEPHRPPAAARWAGTGTQPFRFGVRTCFLYSGDLLVEVRRSTSTTPDQEAQDR